MDAIREIVNSDTLADVINIPRSLKNRQVELIVLPVSDRAQRNPGKKTAYGILKKYANPDLIAVEGGAWAQSAREKHAIR